MKLENQNSLLRVSVGTFFLVFRSAFLVEAEKDDEHGDNLDVKKGLWYLLDTDRKS